MKYPVSRRFTAVAAVHRGPNQLIEAFGGQGYHAGDPDGVAAAMQEALVAGKPSLINCRIDPTAGTERGHLQKLNPKNSLIPAS